MWQSGDREYMNRNRPVLLVSACLMGERVRYDGNDNAAKVGEIPLLHQYLQQWHQEQRLVIACPEQLGGMPTPRTPAEIVTSAGEMSGDDVLTNRTIVVTRAEENVSEFFQAGAYRTLSLAKRYHVSAALLAEKSPSCGVDRIYNGDHNRTIVLGDGVTTALLKQHDIKCFHPRQVDTLVRFMEKEL